MRDNIIHAIVVDSGVLVKWLIREPYTEQSMALMEQHRADDLTLMAPDLLYAEVGNVIWKKQRFDGLELDNARLVLDTVLRLEIAVTPAASILKTAHELAINYGSTVYDSLYLALARQERCPFVTADQKLVNAVRDAMPEVIWLGDWGK